MLVYKITNIKTGEVYIGQTTKSLEWRKAVHIRRLNQGKHSSKLYNAMRKYGVENFEFDQICVANSKDELNRLEKYYIAKYDCINHGYNKQVGGSNSLTYKLDHEARKHISDGIKHYRCEHPFTEEHRAKLSKSMMGNHNFGSGDTRSIGCYCFVDGVKKPFHSYRDAWQWWKDVDNPFNTDAECVYQRKIKQSIKNGYFTYKGYTYYSPKWYREDGDKYEEVANKK